MLINYFCVEPCRNCGLFVVPAKVDTRPLNSVPSATVCADCWSQFDDCHPLIEILRDSAGSPLMIASAVPYNDLMKKLVRRLKYDRDRLIADDFVLLLLRTWPAIELVLEHTPYVVPVPLHWTRRFKRGFNQAELLADGLCNRLGLRLATNILRRRKRTKPHHGLGKFERINNVSEAFEVTKTIQMPSAVVLIDDVFTSGATLAQCTKALQQAGCEQVVALAVARAQLGSVSKTPHGDALTGIPLSICRP